jgi:hypothetical protein
MSTISQYLNQIRNSVYGRDMRSAIYYAIGETFINDGTYENQFIQACGILSDDGTQLTFFIPLPNATKRTITVDPIGIVVYGSTGGFDLNPSVTYAYNYQINGILVTVDNSEGWVGETQSTFVGVQFKYNITLG